MSTSQSGPDTETEASILKQLVARVLMMGGGLGVVVAGLGAINTAAGARWALSYHGARFNLPTEWASVVMVAVLFGVFFAVGWVLAGYRRPASR